MQLVTPLGPGTHTPPSSRSSGFPDEIFLPSHDKCVSLIDVYFKMVYSFLPLFHEETLRSSIAADSSRSASSRGLLFAVLALASNERRDERCRALQAQWYEEAKSQYGSTSHVPDAPIETLQTAVCIILQAMVSGDSSSMWLVLGKAWKQVVALGYHRLDQTSVPRIPGAPPLPQDWVQREAVRRIVWMLYILDRTACLPIGLDFTINENQIGVNLPMGDALFRYSTASPLGLLSIPYKPNLKRMVAAVREAAMQTNHHNTFHHVILNIMMLSNVVSHSRDKEEDPLQDEALGQLEADLFALKISLPRSTTSLTATTYSDLDNAVWVNVLLNLNIIFLNYSKNAASGQISGTHWNHCVTAARNTVGIIRQAASMSVDSLLNPYIASAIFLCGRILIIEYLVPSDATLSPRLWRDIEAITLVFERLEELFGAIGKKFKNGMLYYLAQDTRTLSRIKNSGVKDLLAQCSSWEAAALAASKKNTVECQSWVN
ncbi:fungal-specific transcription factor domain-containing protein [Pseudomassariella vexata]|uniref:Fungal-specific transcription factor domain-domain-containing protein n=1 Tax=Pseudomassariella vexata TaxID=1141098 RepID=A0A1Y2DHY7_9PEZI|nr:fungal-specific transcription factor domain-containing protein [Pseudomassariella vexata]ORY58744.1 fungal-specific transcription factor domain-domain-containing protein [Pseudomassariella vexata]